MLEITESVIVGRFGRPHGVKGLVSIHSFTSPIDNLLSYEPWYFKQNNVWQPVTLLKVTKQGPKIVALVKGFETREQANLLTNLDIAVNKSVLPTLKDDEYYWHDLVGMTVVDAANTPLGEVTEIMETGSNDVLIVKGDERHLIPWLLNETIVSVNREKKQIIVQWDSDF